MLRRPRPAVTPTFLPSARLLDKARHLFLPDLIRQREVQPNATICADEIKWLIDFYPRIALIEALKDVWAIR